MTADKQCYNSYWNPSGTLLEPNGNQLKMLGTMTVRMMVVVVVMRVMYEIDDDDDGREEDDDDSNDTHPKPWW